MGRGQKLAITVTDENGVAVASARVQLQPAASAVPVRCETDFVGRCEFTNLAVGAYELAVVYWERSSKSPSGAAKSFQAE